MKKVTLVSLLAVALLVPAGSVFADATTTPAVIVPQGNGNPLLVQQPWGLSMSQSQQYVFPDGASITLKNGYVFTCPMWFPAGCVDLRWFYGS